MENDNKQKAWLNARDLYRELAIWGGAIPFNDWFTTRIEGEFKIDRDWKVQGEYDDLTFLITQEVYDKVVSEEMGVPAQRIEWSHKAGERGWDHTNNPQTHAITGDEE